MKDIRQLPFINIRDLVIFPKMTQGLFIGRQKTIDAIQYALQSSSKRILVLTQKRVEINDPKNLRDMYLVGSVCSVEGSVLLQDGTMKALLTGERSFKANRIFSMDGVRFAKGHFIKSATQSKSLEEKKRASLLELLVRAKPRVVFDDDADWFKQLRESRRIDQILETLQMNLNYRGCSTSILGLKKGSKGLPTKAETDLINLRTHLQQKILQEPRTEKKLDFLSEYFKYEIQTEAQNI